MRAPGLFADTWQCDAHGPVFPLQPVVPPSVEALGWSCARRRCRCGCPGRCPSAGCSRASPTRATTAAGGRATAVACSGPGPARRHRRADPGRRGAGRGARRAVRGHPRPRPRPAHVRRQARRTPSCWRPAGRPRCGTSQGAPDDRAVFAGEALGLWLWAIVWPEQSATPDVRRAGPDRSAGRGRRNWTCCRAGRSRPAHPVLTVRWRVRSRAAGGAVDRRLSLSCPLIRPSALEYAPCASTCTPTPRPRTVRTPPPSWSATRRRAGLDVVALTDHDTDPAASAQAVARAPRRG